MEMFIRRCQISLVAGAVINFFADKILGYCECPSGKTYAVGDQRNSCGSLSCINGKAGECFKKEGDWSGNSVVCSTVIYLFLNEKGNP